MVDFLLVCIGTEVLVEGLECIVSTMAQVALVLLAIEARGARDVGAVISVVPCQLFVRYHTRCVSLAYQLVDGFAVERLRVGTGACFEVMYDAAGGGMASSTERTGNAPAAVRTAVEMLRIPVS